MTRKNKLRHSVALALFVPIALLLAGPISGAIDTEDRRAGLISGTVVEATTGEPIPLVEIQVLNEAGEYLEAALTDMYGDYSVEGLAPGSYYAMTVESGFSDQLYKDRPCPFGECDPKIGTPIVVRGGVHTKGIDFALSR